MAVTASQIQELYLGYLGRPADQAGLNYWLGQLNADQPTLTLDNLRTSFVASTEYTTLYNGADRAAVVGQIYTNLFGRTASESEIGYWAYASDVSADKLIVAFLNAASTADRATVDAKSAYANQLTATYGDKAAVSDLKGQYASVLASVATEQSGANPPSYAASFKAYADQQLANLVFNTSTGAYNAFSNTSASISLTDYANASIAVTGAELTSVAVNGNLKTSGTTLDISGADLADVTSLTLGLKTSITGTTTVDVSDFTKLATLDASASSSALTIDASASSATLTSFKGGSAADTLTFATGTDATKAVALTVDSGAGNDVLTGTVNAGALTVKAGAGNDQISVSVAKGATGNLVIDAGAGNDNITVTGVAGSTANHSTTVTLGSGTDTLSIAGAANIVAFGGSDAAKASQLAAGVTIVTDFTVGDDTLNLAGLTNKAAAFGTFTSDQTTAIQSASSLSAALALVATDLSAAANNTANAAHFVYGGNTYVYVDNAAAGAAHTFGAGDTLVQLTGVTADVTGSITIA